MNQVLKDVVYGKGTLKQIRFIARLGGMNEEEKQILEMIHDQQTDLCIQEEMGMDRKTYQRVEESIRAKVLIAVFECINCHMEHKEL